jgi:uncharacterized protein (DUF697 family)
MTGEQIGGIVRAILAAVGGYAIGQGWADAELVATVAGGAATIAAAAWSFWSKRKIDAPE